MSKLTKLYGKNRYEDKYISFEADPDILLHDYDKYVAYIKGCEHTVRSDDRYRDYISKIKSAGYDKCAILGNVGKGGDKVKIEMHHGPIFNLFDYCDIVLKYHLKKQDMDIITTYRIGDEILTCHEKDWIMITMLSKTAHRGNHNGDIFIDIKSTVGRVDKFIDKYHSGMEEEHWGYITRYVEACKKANQQTTDQSLFDTRDRLMKFS